jgi:exonuclease SbcC
MRIDRIRLKNLNSLRQEVDINFDEPPLSQTGIFAIVGDTGAGKTTILDALTLALYGKVHRNKDTTEEVLTYGTTECYAEVHFSVAEGQFMAQWSRKRARNKLAGRIQDAHRQISRKTTEGWVVETTKKRECDQLIEQYSGLDYDRFTRSVLLSQGDFAAFLRADPRDRSALLERITGTEYYSRLSQAAFRRAKEEAEKIQQLEQQKSALNILDGSEEKELQAHRKQLQQESAQREKGLRVLRQQLVDYSTAHRLEEESKDLVVKLAQWKSQQADYEEFRLALVKHEKALPLQSGIEKHALIQQQLSGAQQRSLQLELRQKQVRENLAAKARITEQLSASLQELESQEKELFELLDQVTNLDLQIGQLTNQETQLIQQGAEVQKDLTTLEEEVGELQTKRNVLRSRQKELNAWLGTHENLAGIPEALPAIEGKWQVIQRLRFSHQQLETKQHELLAAKKKLLVQMQGIRQAEESLLSEVTTEQKRLEERWPALREQEPEQILQKEQQRLEQMRNQLQWLESAQKLKKLQAEFHAEYNSREEELQHLLNAEQHLRLEVLNAQELLEAAVEQELFHRKVHLQQIRISGLEEHRQHLEDGQPCPLCLSTHHPFRDQEGSLKPFVDEAAAALASAEEKKEAVRMQLKELLAQERNLSDQIIHLAGDQEKGLEGRLDLIQKRITETEQEMAEVLELLRAKGLPTATDAATIRQELQQLHREQEKFYATFETLRTKKEELRDAGEQRKALDWQVENHSSQIAQATQEGQLLQKEIEEKEKEVQQELAPFGITVGGASDFLAGLRQQASSFAQQEKSHSETTSQLQQLEIAQQEKEKQRKHLLKRQTKLAQEVEAIVAKKNQLQTTRQETFGTKKPLEERDKWNAQLREQTQSLNREKNSVVRLEEELLQLEKQVQEAKEGADQQQAQLSELSQELQEEATKRGFTRLEALQAALLPEEQALHWKEQLAEYDRVGQELVTNQKTVSRQLEEAQLKVAPLAPLDSLRSQLEEGESLHKEEQQTLGSIQTRLEENSARKQKQQQLLQRIEVQRKEFVRWEKLNVLIGSADGKKFRVFAQGLTLEKLVQLANQHLQDLNGRYIIHTKEEAELELEIIDTFQADHRRSMNTLSGGESFLVSLSLALGLSDLAGRRTQIRSLFIDEGFGTLDESTLDLALTTLENLQASGKVIGVISHVKELKERIGTQLQIIKGANGFSEVHIRG